MNSENFVSGDARLPRSFREVNLRTHGAQAPSTRNSPKTVNPLYGFRYHEESTAPWVGLRKMYREALTILRGLEGLGFDAENKAETPEPAA